MQRFGGSAAALSIAALAAGCGPERGPAVYVVAGECAGQRDRVLCSGEVAITCVGGVSKQRDDCGARGLACADGRGCRVCAPDTTLCDGARRFRCEPDGSAFALVEECRAGTSCAPAICEDLCARAESERSYLGCEYRAVFGLNSELDGRFKPAVSIGNGNLVAAQVAITKGDFEMVVEVPARSSRTVELEYDPRLKDTPASRLVRGGSYRLEASVPVTVHQYSPLFFATPGACARAGNDAQDICYSHTNDASLLFPASALRPEDANTPLEYLALAWPPMQVEIGPLVRTFPSELTIVALGDRPVRVSALVSAYTRPSIREGGDGGDGGEVIEALAPGQALERTLEPGDVLSLVAAAPDTCEGARTPVENKTFCAVGRDYDLTGTLLRADGPVQVIAGHDCAQVPFDRVACDHLEETLPPLRTWSNSAVVSHPRVPDGSGSVLRLLSAADQNRIRFDPAVHEPVVLGRGELFELYTAEPLYIAGDKPLLVAQFLLGQGTTGNVGGDPSQTIVVPIEQYRRRYNFSTPSTYTFNYADVIARVGDLVRLDGVVVRGFKPIGESGFAVATVQLTMPGAHELAGEHDTGIGVQLYGTALYTSYMLPGGLDLRPLPPQGF